jgi:signal transduction histidine kinase
LSPHAEPSRESSTATVAAYEWPAVRGRRFAALFGWYVGLMALGAVLKPTLGDPAMVWPAHAAALVAYVGTPFRRWPALVAVQVLLELPFEVSNVPLTAAHPIPPAWVLLLALANVLSTALPAAIGRALRLGAELERHSTAHAALWIPVLAIGGLPSAVLGSWALGAGAGTGLTPSGVLLWLLGTLLGIAVWTPVLMLAFRPGMRSRGPHDREFAGVLVAVLAVFALRGAAVGTSFARVPTLMLLTLPLIWTALRCSPQFLVGLVVTLSTALAAIARFGWGPIPAYASEPTWQDPMLMAQTYVVTITAAALLVNKMIVEQRQLLEKIESDNARLHWYARALDEADERTRRRLAGELHDGVAQALAGQQMLVAAMRRQVRDEAAADTLERIGESGRQALADVRAVISELRPAALESASLATALGHLAERMRSVYSFEVAVEIDPGVVASAEEVELGYLLARELVFNAYKHAGTTRATITVRASGGALHVVVADEGVGLPANAEAAARARGSLGLTQLRERVAAAGGAVAFAGGPGRGTRVEVRLPRR